MIKNNKNNKTNKMIPSQDVIVIALNLSRNFRSKSDKGISLHLKLLIRYLRKFSTP